MCVVHTASTATGRVTRQLPNLSQKIWPLPDRQSMCICCLSVAVKQPKVKKELCENTDFSRGAISTPNQQAWCLLKLPFTSVIFLARKWAVNTNRSLLSLLKSRHLRGRKHTACLLEPQIPHKILGLACRGKFVVKQRDFRKDKVTMREKHAQCIP